MKVRHTRTLKVVGEYLLAVVACLILLSLVMHLKRANMHVPFEYTGDALFHGMVVKGMIDHGWYVTNPHLGAPREMELYDFPVTENFHMAVMKVISVFTSDYALVLNLYFILTFPLTTLSSLYVLRHFNLSYGTALVGSLLYTLLPFHFLRNEHHLFLAAYYLIPLAILVVLWICSGAFTLFVKRDGGRWRPSVNKKLALVLLLCVALGSSAVYYPFFACFLLVVGGMLASVHRREAMPLLSALVLVVVISLVVLVNLAPSLVYVRQHGEGTTTTREAGESEVYGLKISQLLLPITFHRVPSLAALKDRYNRSAPLVTENDTASLGFFGSVGFLFLLGWLFLQPMIQRNSRSSLIDHLSALNLATLLLATIGGFSSIFALLISARIRTYNRTSIFIAFFSILAACYGLDLWRARLKSRNARIIFSAALAVLLILGTLDQTGRAEYYRPNFNRIKLNYDSDADLVKQIESQLPREAMIFQLPVARFPEQGPIQSMSDYSHFRGYLHSRTLRWSFGAMKGRADDVWQRYVAAQPTETLMTSLTFAGFAGVYIDREGFADNATKLESDLRVLLGAEPLISRDGRLSFFSLLKYTAQLRQRYTDQEWQAQKEFALHPLLVDWTNGCSGVERNADLEWNWCSSRGELQITNDSSQSRPVKLEMEFATGHAEPATLLIQSPAFAETLKVNSTVQRYTRDAILPPGTSSIVFSCDAQPVKAPADSRTLVFRISRFRLTSVP